jgi:hypothetical protein
MPFSAMSHRVALLRTYVSEERSASVIRVTTIGQPDDGGATSFRNVGSYNT